MLLEGVPGIIGPFFRVERQSGLFSVMEHLEEYVAGLVPVEHKVNVRAHRNLLETDDAVDLIASLAMERKTGARGLRSIMEKTMMNVMYEIPSDESIEKVIITKDSVLGNSETITVRKGGDYSKAV